MIRCLRTGSVRLLLVVLALLAVCAPLAAPARASAPAGHGSPQESAAHGPVVFVGVSGLTFEMIDPARTPHLYALAASGATGTMTPRSVRATSCPADGWLAVGSGRRAADEPRDLCRPLADPIDGWVPDWDVYLAQADDDSYDAGLGALAESDASLRAVGPGAAIAAAAPNGRISDPLRVADVGAQTATGMERADITLIDLGGVYDRTFSLDVLDEQIGEAVAAVAAQREEAARSGAAPASLLVASISDGRAHSGSLMQMSILDAPSAPHMPAGLLTSSSTRQPGLVQTTDIAPTLLDLAGAEPAADANLAGAPMRTIEGPSSAAGKLQLMGDRQAAVAAQASLSTWFYPALGLLLASLLVVAAVVGRRDFARVRPLLRGGGAFLAAMPVSTYLVNLIPWERSTTPEVAMLAGVAGFALALAVVALAGPWHRSPIGPISAIAVATVAVIAYDVLTGSRLQMSTLLGEPLLIASRFYGIGNSALALYCTALLVALGAICSLIRPRWAVIATVVAAVVGSCVLLATPGLGTKFGSVPTLIIGSAVLLLTAAGIHLSWKRLLLFGGGAAAVMLLVLVVDWLRPAEDRTHFGRFFDSIISGEAGAVLARKIGMNIDILTQSWMTLLLPIVIAAVLWAAIFPERLSIPSLPRIYARHRLLRPALVSLAVLLAVGTVINDSGIVVPAVGLLFLVPALAHLAGVPEAGSGPRAASAPQVSPGASDRT